jgi:Glycerophosphoryl diester phosphodiesterase family
MALRTLARRQIGRIFHLLRPFKHVENSKRGARRAKRLGFKSIDWDLQITKDGVIVVCHDNQPMLHGFFDPLGRLPRDAKISELTWAQVSRLLARSGGLFYRIRRIETMLAFAAHLGLVALLEPKSNRRFSLDWVWQYIAKVAEDVGATVSVRALRELHGEEHVAAARRAGIKAWVI